MPSVRHVGLAIDIEFLAKNHTGTFAGVQQYAVEAGWNLVLDNWPEESFAKGRRGAVRYDGIIVRVVERHLDLVELAAKAGVPLVNVLCGSPVFSVLPGVFPDYAAIGRLQAEHLLNRGVRSLAFLTIGGRRPDELQFSGFKEVAELFSKPVHHFELDGTWDDSRELYRQTRNRLWQWINTWQRPTGLATCTDDLARVLAQMCHERGWRVPSDVAVVGSRNEEHFCNQPRPALSSVEIGFERVGYEAARLLESLMNRPEPLGSTGSRRAGSRESSPPEHVILPPVGIVTRESTDAYASPDPIVAEALTFIEKHCHTAIDVGDVASAIMVSPSTLKSHFADAMRTTVALEIRRARVELAKRELTGSDLSIAEVATLAGFTSNARLCEAFRREVGVSPREYRELRKKPRRRGR